MGRWVLALAALSLAGGACGAQRLDVDVARTHLGDRVEDVLVDAGLDFEAQFRAQAKACPADDATSWVLYATYEVPGVSRTRLARVLMDDGWRIDGFDDQDRELWPAQEVPFSPAMWRGALIQSEDVVVLDLAIEHAEDDAADVRAWATADEVDCFAG